MVRAVLNNSKTQTRRVFKVPRGCSWYDALGGEREGWLQDDAGPAWWHVSEQRCPYGRPGDRLWLRETTRSYYLQNFLTGEPTNALCGQYVSDDEPVLNEHGFDIGWWYSRKTCPAIHMPRWASRITLEVTGVRVETLGIISHEDALAEGVSSIEEYKALWININGAWLPETWVWVVDFRMVLN